jgi:hypothetical protein
MHAHPPGPGYKYRIVTATVPLTFGEDAPLYGDVVRIAPYR